MSYTVLVEWKRWFAWRPVRLQHSARRAWLCFVEYEQIQIPIYTAFGGRGISGTVTHYRMPDDAACFRMASTHTRPHGDTT